MPRHLQQSFESLLICYFCFFYFRKSWEFVCEECYLIGVGKHQNVCGEMAIALRDVVSAPAMTTFLFQRALIRGRGFHSKRYGRVHQRNSYTVIFQDDSSLSYGQIECFAKVKQNCCRCPVPAICTCTAWMYLAVVNRLYLTNEPVEAGDGSVKVTLQHIVKAYLAV